MSDENNQEELHVSDHENIFQPAMMMMNDEPSEPPKSASAIIRPALSAKFDEETLNKERIKSRSKSPDKNKSAKSSKNQSGKSRKSAIKSGKSLKSSKSSRSARSRKSSKSGQKSAKKKSTPELEDLTDMGLTMLDNKIFERTTLRKLILTGNNLRTLPAAIGDLFNLEYLDVSKNPLKVKDAEDTSCFPIEMRLLKVLKFISISECNLRHVPTTIWMCASLETLDLSRNKISLVVPDIGNLQNLLYINLSQCNLTTLPNEIGFCAELKEIILMGNQIESLPDSLKECDNLEVLRLSYRNFSTMLDSYMDNLIFKGQIKSEHIPPVVFDLAKMTNLDLKHTKINTIPDNNLCGMLELNLDFNYISTLAENSMKSMTNIRILTLSNNFLKEIPAEINNLLSLEVLDLSCNTITEITNNSNLKNLKELNLSSNRLNGVNDNIKYFKGLQKLRLEKNAISELSEELYELDMLFYLDLCYNRIIRLSEKLVRLKSLKLAHSYIKLERTGLWLIGNPLKIPSSDYWSTTHMEKMHNYLSSYIQRNLDYVFYSKLVFIGLPNTGKSSLIDSFYHIVEKDEQRSSMYETKLMRKLFKRTINKVEWAILDFGGHEIYRSFHSIVFSSIDPDNEPTLFVIVYNHTEYTKEDHDKHIGEWINSILMHTRASATNNVINIKLIGIVHDILFDFYEESKDEELKMNSILSECGVTIDFYYQKLIHEKIRQSNLNNKEANLEQLDLLLNRRVYLNGDILLIESNYNKDSIAKVMNCLENITIGFNKIIPLELNIKLKNHISKIKSRKLNLNDFRASIDKNIQLNKMIKMYEKYDLNTDRIIYYTKTMCDIFWMKYDKRLSEKVFLHLNYLINTFKAIIRHDLNSNGIVFNEKSAFKSVGIYETENEFEEAKNLFERFGILEWKLLQGLCFDYDKLDRNEIKECIKLWEQFHIAYKSETEFIEDPCCFTNIIIPMQCSEIFDPLYQINKEMHELFTDDYEKYFIRIDLTREYRERVKAENVVKKKRFAWKFKEKESELHNFQSAKSEVKDNGSSQNDLNEDDDESIQSFLKFEDESRLFNLGEIKILELLSPLIQKETDQLTFNLHKTVIECWSNLKLDKNLFYKLSCLIQSFVNERFDWNETIIARDCDDNFLKIQLVPDKDSNKLRIEIKSKDIACLNRLKYHFIDLIKYLFDFFPGLMLAISYD